MGPGLRRLALAAARPAGPGKPWPHLPRPLPDRRREDARRIPHRALVLVRPALPPGPERAAAPPARRCLAHRLPAGLGRGPRGREKAREHYSPHPRPAGQGRALRAGMGQRLHLRLPAHGPLRPWPRGLRGRQRPRRLAVWRTRRQQRRAGCREPGLEAGPRAARPGRCLADRHLRRRARIRGRREHPQLHARHRLHHAQERDQPPVPRRRAGPGARP